MPAPAAPTTWTGGHLPALDGLRGIAVLLVMLLHFRMSSPELLADRVVVKFLSAGWIGVDLFFVLSGFLITGILYDSKGAQHYFRNFYARRVLRIFPLYYAFLVLRFLILPQVYDPAWTELDNPWGTQWWAWLYLTNVQVALHGWDAPASYTAHFWSLAIEEQFYLLWPLVVFLFSRRQLMAICATMILAAALTGVALRVGFGNPQAAYTLMPARMDGLAFGALLALAVRGPRGLAPVLRWARPALAACAAALVALFVARRGLASEDAVVQTVGYTVLAVFFGALLVVAIAAPARGRAGRVFTHPTLRFFGRYSYAMYIIHLPMTTVISMGVFAIEDVPTLFGSRLPGQIAFTATAVAATVLLSVASWHLFENHFLKLKDRVPYLAPRPVAKTSGRPAPRPLGAAERPAGYRAVAGD